MSKYYEIKYPVKGKDDKTYWNRCGTAFLSKNGDGFSIILDAVPVATEKGQLRLAAFPPKPREDGGTRPQSGGAATYDLNDDIPF